MRDILTALAALVAVALLTLMVGPYFVDWQAQRPRLAALVQERTGLEVRFGGALQVSLLPTPSIDAEDVAVGGADNPLLSARRIAFSLSPTALLTGRFVLSGARIEKPELTIAGFRDLMGQGAAGEGGPGEGGARISLRPGQIGLSRLELIGATFRDAPAIPSFDAQVEAPSLAGPYRLDLRETSGARELRFQIGQLEGGRARMKGVVEDKAVLSRVALDGWFGVPGVEGRPLFDGAATFSGNPVVPGGNTQLPFQGTARLLLHLDQAIADPVNITLGTGENAANLAGQLYLDLTAKRPTLSGKLATRRFDLAGVPGGFSARGLAGTALPFLDLALDLAAEAVQVPGGTLRDFELSFAREAGMDRIVRASVLLPGASRMKFQRSENAGATILDGRLSLVTDDLQAFAAWLRGSSGAPGLPAHASLSADLTGGPESIAIRGIDIRSPSGNLAGNGTLAATNGPPKLALSLAAERFDARVIAALDPLRPIPGLALSSKLEVTHLVLDGQELGGLRVMLEREGDAATLRELRLTGRRGEELSMSGGASGEALHFTAKLDADRVADIARLSAALLPGPLTSAFVARAGLIEPAIAVGNFRITNKVGEAVWDVAVDGKLGGTELHARTISAVRGDNLEVTVDAEASNPDGVRLASQLAGTPATASRQPGQLKIKVHGNPRRDLDGSVTGMLAGVDIDFKGRVSPFKSIPADGRFTLRSSDLSLLGEALGGGAPFLAQNLSGQASGRFFFERNKLTLTGFDARFGEAPVAGEISFDFARGGQVAGQLKAGEIALATLLQPIVGRTALLGVDGWARGPFPPALPPLLSGDLWIEAKALDLGGVRLSGPQFILRFAPGSVALTGFESRLGDGQLGGQLTLLRKDNQVESSGVLRFARIPAPVLGGTAGGEVPFTAGGGSMADLVASLSGAGKIVLDNVTIENADPTALGRLAARPLEDLEPVNDNTIGGLLDSELRKGTLRLSAGERSAGLLNGNLRIGTTKDEGEGSPPGVAVTPDIQADLLRRDVEARITFRSRVLPAGWSGAMPEMAVVLSGRLGGASPPRRTLQVAPLVNGLLAMVIQRDLERVEAFEADLREREAHLRRQRGDAFRQRREEEIRAVEEAIALEAAALRRRQEVEAERERVRALDERLARERAEKEAAELAARTRARLEEEKLRSARPPGADTPPPVVPAPSAPPLDLTPKVSPPG